MQIMSVADEKSSGKILMGQDNNALVMLFAINSLVFCILKFILVIYQMSELNQAAYFPNIFNWFILPADITRLGSRPWTLITSMFTHKDVMSVLPAMAWLWVFGYVLQDLTGNRKLVPIYIYGGMVGSMVYIVSYYI